MGGCHIFGTRQRCLLQAKHSRCTYIAASEIMSVLVNRVYQFIGQLFGIQSVILQLSLLSHKPSRPS